MKFWEQPDATYYSKNKFGKARMSEYDKREAAHAILYCKTKNPEQNKYAVMMQLRFDGTLGFPGGYIDGESWEDGLNRELQEELGLESQYNFLKNNYFGTWVHTEIGLIDHLYVKEFSENDFNNIEANILNCKDWGGETLGILRVPLTDTSSIANFFKNNFVGNAREQLIRVLLKKKILTKIELKDAWNKMNLL